VAVGEIGVPPAALLDIDAHQLLGTSTAFRRQLRAVLPHLPLPGETAMVKEKLRVAEQQGTATESRKIGEQHVAYLSNPLFFINIVTNYSSFICIGIDKGNQSTKIGISYECQNRITYSALMVSSGDDTYEDLLELKENTPIFNTLQSLIDNEKQNQKVFVCCDMKTINAIIGIKQASSNNPCPICITHKSKLNHMGNERQQVAHTRSTSARNSENDEVPLLNVKSKRIVPIPLHIYLGLCNKIIDDTLPQLVEDDEVLTTSSQSVKAVSLTGNVGASRVYSLNGPALDKYIREEKIYQVYNELPYDEYNEQLTKLQSWMTKLHDNLLTKNKWTAQKTQSFKVFVDELLTEWKDRTLTKLTPKCHMLLHCIQFVKNFDYLGKYNESQLESYHGKFLHKQSINHFNTNHNKGEQLRRVLADSTLQAIVNCV
jgi:hypothetical protein